MASICDMVKPVKYVPFNNNKMKNVKGMKNGTCKCMKSMKRNIILKNNINKLI